MSDDPEHRTVVHRYAVWYHLRSLRARTSPQKPVTDGQAVAIHDCVRAAAAVLATLAESGRTLTELRHADVDVWRAGRRVARRAGLGLFLRWARRERLTALAVPVQQWAGPDGRIDHDQRWTLARRLGFVGDTERHLSLTASAGHRRAGMVFLRFRPPALPQANSLPPLCDGARTRRH